MLPRLAPAKWISRLPTPAIQNPSTPLMTTFAAATTSLVLACAVPALGHAQASAPAALASFEASSVKPNRSGDLGAQYLFRPAPGGITASNISLRDYVKWAYGVRDYQISAPAWFNEERYDIVTKTGSPASNDQLRRMLQTLLADRFKMVLRHENKNLSVYAMTVGKNGPKLHEVEGAGPVQFRSGHFSGPFSMPDLAAALSTRLDLPVVDQTGLTGFYNLTLDWTPDNGRAGPGDGESGTPGDKSRPSIFVAIQEQLGLKLQAQKGPVDVLVIDRAEKTPTEN